MVCIFDQEKSKLLLVATESDQAVNEKGRLCQKYWMIEIPG